MTHVLVEVVRNIRNAAVEMYSTFHKDWKGVVYGRSISIQGKNRGHKTDGKRIGCFPLK